MKKGVPHLLLILMCLFWSGASSAQECQAPFFGGFYFGANVGFVHARSYLADLDAFFLGNTNPKGIHTPGSLSAKNLNWAGGVQLGYDWTCGHSLFGLVADWDWTNAHAKTAIFEVTTTTIDIFTESELRWLSTLRARFGFFWKRALLYFTAGAAAADFKTLIHSNLLALSPTIIIENEKFTFKKTRWGWTAGFGGEFALSCHWAINAELLYAGFSTYQMKFFSPTLSDTFRFNANQEVWLGRIGLKYRIPF